MPLTEIDPAMDMVKYLKELAVGGDTRFDWIKLASDDPNSPTAFVNDLPDTPDQAVGVFRYSGRPPDAVFGQPFSVRHPRVQFMIRDPDSEVGLDRLTQIMKVLGVIRDREINGTTYQSVVPQGEPEEVGPDSSDRQRATLNFEVSFYDS